MVYLIAGNKEAKDKLEMIDAKKNNIKDKGYDSLNKKDKYERIKKKQLIIILLN